MRIFLAATEPFPEVRQATPFALDTFFYIDPSKPSDHRRFEDYLLDSGAFSFMQGGKRKESFEEYIENYANYIVKNDIKNYIEMDIDRLVGYDKVLEIRKYLEKKTDRPCIPVWHDWRGKQDFVDMCRRYEYVALGGFAKIQGRNGILYNHIKNFIDEAHRNHARIHGLGFTKLEPLTRLPFDSVDSTTWLNPAKYGELIEFTGNNLRRVPHPKGMRRVGDARNAVVQGGLEWVKFQKYAKEHL